MFKNEYTIPLIIAFVLNWFALSLVATATVYFARDILGDANSMKVLNNARTLPAMIFLVIGVVPFFATKWGKKFTLLFACGSYRIRRHNDFGRWQCSASGFRTSIEKCRFRIRQYHADGYGF